MVKLIIFDFWGTLVENGVFPSPVRQVKYILRVEEPFSEYIVKFENALMLKKYDDLYSAFMSVCEAFGKSPEKFILDRLVGMWNKHKILAKPFREAVEVLEKLKKEGYTLALISDTDCFTTDEVLDKYDLRKYFDEVALSYKVNMLKTDPKMYALILEKLGVDKSDALVVGDSIETDINGAKEAGIKAVLVDRRDSRDFSPKISNLNELEGFLKE
ncbi:MAG: HAD family hydrolase [Chloroflexota bacterium]|nr:HAD family hydrolase [Chloroflexota bacterium]